MLRLFEGLGGLIFGAGFLLCHLLFQMRELALGFKRH